MAYVSSLIRSWREETILAKQMMVTVLTQASVKKCSKVVL